MTYRIFNKNLESGRSLIEVIGVLAITGVMAASTIAMYSVVRRNQTRQIASSTLEQIAKNTKLLLEMSGDYTDVSVDYLIKAGALQSDKAPIGGTEWSVVSSTDGLAFSINLSELSETDCKYLSVATPKWATAVMVNGYETEPSMQCFSSQTHQVSFIIE